MPPPAVCVPSPVQAARPASSTSTSVDNFTRRPVISLLLVHIFFKIKNAPAGELAAAALHGRNGVAVEFCEITIDSIQYGLRLLFCHRAQRRERLDRQFVVGHFALNIV